MVDTTAADLPVPCGRFVLLTDVQGADATYSGYAAQPVVVDPAYAGYAAATPAGQEGTYSLPAPMFASGTQHDDYC